MIRALLCHVETRLYCHVRIHSSGEAQCRSGSGAWRQAGDGEGRLLSCLWTWPSQNARLEQSKYFYFCKRWADVQRPRAYPVLETLSWRSVVTRYRTPKVIIALIKEAGLKHDGNALSLVPWKHFGLFCSLIICGCFSSILVNWFWSHLGWVELLVWFISILRTKNTATLTLTYVWGEWAGGLWVEIWRTNHNL